ncbi:MAG: NAD(P)H-hydrate epimerase [Pirellulales bacterium]|nr:NAD(P)H-hydrate epimerase [Pirellulales bacterium]
MLALSRAKVREVDAVAIDEYSLPGIVLMENAGRNASEAIVRLFDSISDQNVVVLVGPGNNGGDGLVIARYLELAGAKVRVVLASPPQRFRGDSLTNLEIINRSGINQVCLAGAVAEQWQNALLSATCVIDAILGTGATDAARGDSKVAIESILGRMKIDPRPRVISIDVPSGFDCDRGVPCGPCVCANETLTFVASKQGFKTNGAEIYTGRIQIVDIGVPQVVRNRFGL